MVRIVPLFLAVAVVIVFIGAALAQGSALVPLTLDPTVAFPPDLVNYGCSGGCK